MLNKYLVVCMFTFYLKMAQMAQTTPDRNTNNIRSGNRAKSRNWCFTLNNYTEEEIKSLCEAKYQYIFQEETGAEGTPHLQGVIILNQPQALSYMKKINRRAHWEITRNVIASKQYCSKENTRSGRIYANIPIPREVGTNGTAQNDTRDPQRDIQELVDNSPFWIDQYGRLIPKEGVASLLPD